jgi:hypothetical protein
VKHEANCECRTRPRSFMKVLRQVVLWVIFAILLVLVGGLFFPRHSGPSRSRPVIAKVEVIQLGLAMKSYHSDYGEWPARADSSGAEFVAILAGQNPRRIVYMEFPDRIVSNRCPFLDPWGSPFHVRVGSGLAVRVWSNGPDRKDDRGEGDDIGNW